MAKRVSLKGKGAELFFGDYDASPDTQATGASPPADEAAEPLTTLAPDIEFSTPSGAPPDTPKSPSRRKTSLRSAAETNGSAIPADAMSAPFDVSAIEAIRQVIKSPGREVSYVRLTPEEKAQLSDIVYTYKRQGQKTSETEINRIAINYLLLDFQEHGEHSVLARVLAALQA